MANIGDKFIIEIEAKSKRVLAPDFNKTIYTIKGMESHFFYDEDISKIERYDEDEKANADFDAGYREGLNSAWSAAKEFVYDFFYNLSNRDICTKYGIDVKWGDSIIKTFFENISVAETIQAQRTYEERKKSEEEIKVGDEILGLDNKKAIVTKVSEYGIYYVLFDGTCRNTDKIDFFKIYKKTGRHFPQIAEVLGKMREV